MVAMINQITVQQDTTPIRILVFRLIRLNDKLVLGALFSKTRAGNIYKRSQNCPASFDSGSKAKVSMEPPEQRSPLPGL
jgi:hypothetical protein